MTEILLGPTIQGGPTQKVKDKKTGKVYFKKQILPVGKYKYKDQELDLSDGNLATIAKSFNDKAYDEVASQFGGTESEHNNDPLRRNGTTVAVEHVPGKGMWGYFDLTADGQEFVKNFPNAGVSPRIVTGIERADGKKFDAAIEHVLFTNVPRMNGMKGWEKVELSQGAKNDGADKAEVLDFSAQVVEPVRIGTDTTAGTSLVNKTSEGSTDNEKDNGMPQLSKEQLDFLTTLMADSEKFEQAFGDGKETQQTAPVIPAELSNGVTEAKNAANTALAAAKALQEQARNTAWATKKRELALKGVPPAALDLADPVMLREPQSVIDLSNGDGATVKSDEQQIMLSQLELMAGFVDLSQEQGHGIGGFTPEQGYTQDEIDAFMQANGI